MRRCEFLSHFFPTARRECKIRKGYGAQLLGLREPWGFFCNSLRASLAIHLAAGESSCLIAEAHSIATARRWLLRFPIWRKAQFTAFFTKLRSSPAYCLINGKKGKNASSLARLS